MKEGDAFKRAHQMLRAGMSGEALKKVYDDGKDTLRSPYDGDPNHGWYLVGDIYNKRRDFEKAAIAFERAVSFRLDDVQALIGLGNAYSEMGSPGKSERALRSALQFDRENKNAIYNLGNALFDQGKYKDAIKEYLRIGKSDKELSALALKNLKIARRKARA